MAKLAGLEAVQLSDAEAQLDATFVPDAGMICCSLRHRGEELLSQEGGLAEYEHDGHTMGLPLLYPWANRLAAFDYRVGARSVRIPHDPERIQLETHGLPIHGVIGGRMAWTTAARDRGSLTARLRWDDSDPELFELFPFHHELVYEARLSDARLELDLTVHAAGTDAVPLVFGFHPYLRLPGVPRERWLVELPAMRRLELDESMIPIGPDGALSSQRFELAEQHFDDAFDQVAESSRFAVTGGSRRIEVEFREGYRYAQVFAPGNAACICFEPMAAPANALRSGTGLRMLASGDSARARFSLRVLDLP
jgi:galactose mutarotase-like enzyme